LSNVNKAEIDKVFKDFEKEVKRFTTKTYVVVVICGIAISVVSSLHGLSEAWAWEVAKAIISINGLLIGFGILGITVFSRRRYSETMYKKSAEQLIAELINKLRNSKKKPEEISEELKKELVLRYVKSFVKSFLDVATLRVFFSEAIESLIISIGFAICLFGVNPETASNPFLSILFSSVYTISISTFLVGTLLIIRGISTTMEKTTEISISKSFEIFASIFEKKIEELKKEQNKPK